MFNLHRSSHNPLFSPIRDHGWEELATFNGSPLRDGKKIHFTYRAVAKPDKISAPDWPLSTVGYAYSTDGVHFSGRRQLIKPEHDWECCGCEDPRLSKLDDEYFIFYTAISKNSPSAENIKIAVAITKDFKTIKEKHLVTPFNAKAMTLFPERIDGKITAILTVDTDKPPTKMAIAQFSNKEEIWSKKFWTNWYKNIDRHTLTLKRSETDQIEVGAAPVKTKIGWVLIYSHIQNYFSSNKLFGVEAVLLQKNNPREVICRTSGPFLTPETIYEKYGMVPDIVFPTGALIYKDKLDIYYGAADTTTCRASVKLNDLLATMRPDTKFQEIQRYDKNPIIESRKENNWESRSTFNPGAVEIGGNIYIFYRAMSSNNTSSIGLATSKDGLNIDERLHSPIYEPKEDFEMKRGDQNANSGCEDPRVTILNDRIYMCYTAYDSVHAPRVAVTSIATQDFLDRKWEWEKSVLITPGGVDDKDACVLDHRVNGKYMILHRVDRHICADTLDNLKFKTEQVNRCIEILEPRRGMWDSQKVGISAPPILTKKGWLLFYHGVSDDNTYRVGAALLKKDDLAVVLARTADPIFEPHEDYEKNGDVSNVVFPCGAVLRKDTIFLYYGGGDKVVGVATTSLKKVLDALWID